MDDAGETFARSTKPEDEAGARFRKATPPMRFLRDSIGGIFLAECAITLRIDVI